MVDDHRMLQALAGPPREFDSLRQEARFDIFARRCTEDFGLPDPKELGEEPWRMAATARLLCTEAAEGSPREQPREPDKIIAPGLPRTHSLRLLKQWQHDIRYIASFERLVPQAEATIGLTYWARNLTSMPRSWSSRAVEEALFLQTADRLDRLEEVDVLADELGRDVQTYKDREGRFWGREASNPVGWRYLVELAGAASLIVENRAVEESWKTVTDAIDWYSLRGWQLDQAGEQLFKESADLPPQLHRIRARLRRGYLRTMDRVGRTFSELLAKRKGNVFELPTAGEVALAELPRDNAPTALVFLDACRLDLGWRLAQLLNQGEPTQRATVITAVAPVPSITPLGMSFALPVKRDKLHVRLADDGKSFHVSIDGFDGDLKWAEQRRKWLKQNLDVKDWLEIEEVLDGESLKKPGRGRRLIAVHGDEFDSHDGQLKITGADEHLRRYVQAIRKLRDAGYSRVIVLSDHGFFHWQPDDHEIVDDLPTGDGALEAPPGHGRARPVAPQRGSHGDSAIRPGSGGPAQHQCISHLRCAGLLPRRRDPAGDDHSRGRRHLADEGPQGERGVEAGRTHHQRGPTCPGSGRGHRPAFQCRRESAGAASPGQGERPGGGQARFPTRRTDHHRAGRRSGHRAVANGRTETTTGVWNAAPGRGARRRRRGDSGARGRDTEN